MDAHCYWDIAAPTYAQWTEVGNTHTFISIVTYFENHEIIPIPLIPIQTLHRVYSILSFPSEKSRSHDPEQIYSFCHFFSYEQLPIAATAAPSSIQVFSLLHLGSDTLSFVVLPHSHADMLLTLLGLTPIARPGPRMCTHFSFCLGSYTPTQFTTPRLLLYSPHSGDKFVLNCLHVWTLPSFCLGSDTLHWTVPPLDVLHTLLTLQASSCSSWMPPNLPHFSADIPMPGQSPVWMPALLCTT